MKILTGYTTLVVAIVVIITTILVIQINPAIFYPTPKETALSTIKITVTDATTRTPLDGVHARIEGPIDETMLIGSIYSPSIRQELVNVTMVTELDGVAVFKNIPLGRYRLAIWKEGYFGYTFSHNVVTELVKLDIPLSNVAPDILGKRPYD